MKHLRLCCLLLASGLGTASHAAAYDSHTAQRTHTCPSFLGPVSGFPQGIGSEDSLNGNLRYQFSIRRDSLGGTQPDGSDNRANPGLYLCQAADVVDPFDVEKCQPVANETKVGGLSVLDHSAWGWLNARKAWNGEDSEHYLIAAEAAKLAGLVEPQVTIFKPFWVRYPTANRFIGSVAHPDLADSPNAPWIVGQSWEPKDLWEAETFVTRGISLLELTQAPDFSHSLADWAAGNETCPVAEARGIFKGDDVNACHAFGNLMGAINATHFRPLNRQVYTYYHLAALEVMKRCNVMHAQLGQRFSGNWFSGPPHPDPSRGWMPLGGAEVKECEAQAMAYEMFAQHFLQDAWSSGHMWRRFGYPTLGEFPAVLETERITEADVPDGNVMPRKALNALMVGALSGMIHGAKSVVFDLVKDFRGPAIAENVRARGLLDDPLNGPYFYELTLFAFDRGQGGARAGRPILDDQTARNPPQHQELARLRRTEGLSVGLRCAVHVRSVHCGAASPRRTGQQSLNVGIVRPDGRRLLAAMGYQSLDVRSAGRPPHDLQFPDCPLRRVCGRLG
jgi:hypothetical protein